MESKKISRETMLTTVNDIIENTRRQTLNEVELSDCIFYLALTIKYMLEAE